jgi:hypothetical protein
MMACILPTTKNVIFALVDEKYKNIMKKSYEFCALISKLRLGDDGMSIETYIQMEMENISKLELSIDELMDVVLGINYTQDFDLNVAKHQ